MTILVLAQHDNETLNAATLTSVQAATQIASLSGAAVHLLVAGSGCQAVADAAAAVEGVAEVLLADAPQYGAGLAEEIAPLIAQVAGDGYSHVLCASTSQGKDALPRAAALLDVGQISDIVAVVAANQYKRPVYAGNAIATVESLDSVQVITVRASAFDAVAATGGSASVRAVEGPAATGLSEFVSNELVKSDRPDLASADV
ncbi:MAG: electron transfer flavoprotein subunit alpha/FixB family protein, partial [Oceanobacter sp.]